MDIGKRLRALREARKLSQGDIERRTGLIRAYVSRVENGYTIPSIDTLARWADGLRLELYQLFFKGEGQPKAAKIERNQNPLTAAEHGLIKIYRSMRWADRRTVITLMRQMAKPRG